MSNAIKYNGFTKKALTEAIDGMAAYAVSHDEYMGRAVQAVLEHAAQHREVSLVNKLWLAFPKSGRKSALKAFMLRFAPVVANTDKQTKAERPWLFKDRDGLAELVQEAGTKPFYEHAPDKTEATSLDVVAELGRLVARIEKAEAKGVALKGDASAVKSLHNSIKLAQQHGAAAAAMQALGFK